MLPPTSPHRKFSGSASSWKTSRIPRFPATILRSDNQAAIRLVRNPEFHKRTKHVDVKYYIIREHYQNSLINVVYVTTGDNVADILTKALPRDAFQRLLGLMNITTTPCVGE